MLLYTLQDSQTKLISFYTGFTCICYLLLLTALYFTNYIYSVGKYVFYPVIGLVLVVECIKYFVGSFYVLKSARSDDKFLIGSTKKNSLKVKVREVFKCCLYSVGMITIYFIIAILFGAEVFNKHEETLMFSVLLAALTVFPCCIHMGSNAVVSVLMGVNPSGDNIGLYLIRIIQGTLFGAWLGAFVIPLDWDRPWQEWPIPCSVGAMLGFIGGHVFALINSFPKFSKKKPGRKQRLS